MKLQKIIERHWYSKIDPFLFVLLFPFSIVYECITSVRKFLFTIKVLPSRKLPVPIVIIGNITVGGAGKTPLTKHIARQLTERGFNVGIILRGYKSETSTTTIVTKKHSSRQVGDEALIYAQAGFRVAIGSKRVDAAKLLLETYPETQIILADDGMQHYYMKRDMEICVVDSSRMFGNQQILPLGPLRENMDRLKKVDAIIVNGQYNQVKLAETLAKYSTNIYQQNLEFIDLYNPITKESKSASEFKNTPICALAGIGNPGRFYDYLEKLGLDIKAVKSFPDHHKYVKDDIISKIDTIVTTEKDYTKIAEFKPKNIWIARVEASLNSDKLLNQIINLIKKDKNEQ